MPAAKRLVSLADGVIRASSCLSPSPARHDWIDVPWNPDSTATGDNDRYTIMINTYLAARSQITNHIGTIMVWSGNEYDMQVANGVNRCRRYGPMRSVPRDMGVPTCRSVISVLSYREDDPSTCRSCGGRWMRIADRPTPSLA